MTMKNPIEAFDAREDFSVVLGGPLYQLLCRAHLSRDALELSRQRIVEELLKTLLEIMF